MIVRCFLKTHGKYSVKDVMIHVKGVLIYVAPIHRGKADLSPAPIWSNQSCAICRI